MTYVLVSLALLTPAQHRHCRELFTPAMGERAAQVIYRETRHVTRRNLRLLGYIERCQQRPGDQARVRSYDHHQSAMHEARLAPPLDYATASWYDDQTGQTASGYHSYYGVANRSMGFGTKVLFVYHGREVEATVDDRGPYIAGRTWDLNQNTAGALGFGGVAVVGYRIGG